MVNGGVVVEVMQLIQRGAAHGGRREHDSEDTSGRTRGRAVRGVRTLGPFESLCMRKPRRPLRSASQRRKAVRRPLCGSLETRRVAIKRIRARSCARAWPYLLFCFSVVVV